MEKMNLYTAMTTEQHTGGMMLIAANTIEEAEKIAATNHYLWGYFEQVKGATIECNEPYIIDYDAHEG